MRFKKLSLWVAAAGISLLAGCNLFNPNGAEESSCEDANAECYITLGQSLINQGNFPASMNAYAKAIEIDSNKSEAYYGYATAATFAYRMNLGSLVDDMQKAGKNPTAFMDHGDGVLTLRIQMASAVTKVLSRLADRDSLTRWYNYLSDSSQRTSDPYFAARKAFITQYLDTVTAPSRKRERFPLSDRKERFESNVFQYAPHLLLYTIMHTYDIDGNEVFNDADRVMRNLLSADGKGLGNLTELADQMREDTVLQQNINNKLVELQSGMGDLGEIMQMFQVNPADTAGQKGQSKGQIDSVITSLGGTLVFYQFGDRLDNDGDGCIDEEIVDSLDNDLDGFYDEDARLLNGNGIPTNLPNGTGPADGVDNDRNGLQDANDAGENKFGGVIEAVKDLLTFAVGKNVNFVEQNAHKDGPWMDIRVRIQADSLAVRLTPRVRPIPAQYQAKLDSAKTYIGGCWHNY